MSDLPLDLFSITQTKTSESIRTLESEIEQSYGVQWTYCPHGAPFICFRSGEGRWYLAQGCCNRWTCPRCGQIRARHEYGRMVNGATELEKAGHTLYFWTLTCRGGNITQEEGESGYMKWTNRLLTAARTQATRAGAFWAYAQVTEYQKRGLPHSHLITTYCPPDAVFVEAGTRRPDGIVTKHDCLFSQWFQDRNVSAGLGPMCDISQVRTAIGAITYVGKYLFKTAVFTEWPKNWHRVRYSRSWPKLPELDSENEAFPVMSMADWRRVERLPKVRAKDDTVYWAAMKRLIVNVLPPVSEHVSNS